MTQSVVVGVDGSRSSTQAVRAAAREAELRGAGLRLVHAFGWPMPHVPPGGPPWNPDTLDARELADGTLADAERLAREVAPRVETTRHVTVGEPLMVLEIESRTASVVVVGSRGLNAFTSLLLGSTAGHLAAHARCPVLVVRGRGAPEGPVLLGVDDAPACREAVRFAFSEASLRGAELLAVHVSGSGSVDAYDGPANPPFVTRDARRERVHAEHVLDSVLAAPTDEYAHVTVRRMPVVGRVRPTLVEASADAQLLVVGARGRGGFAGLLLGSVSQALLHHAQCPVAVARHAGPPPP